jgi:hypothetical protein
MARPGTRNDSLVWNCLEEMTCLRDQNQPEQLEAPSVGG